jgi:ribosomal protein S18 acetylase RimI-like enzyme
MFFYAGGTVKVVSCPLRDVDLAAQAKREGYVIRSVSPADIGAIRSPYIQGNLDMMDRLQKSDSKSRSHLYMERHFLLERDGAVIGIVSLVAPDARKEGAIRLDLERWIKIAPIVRTMQRKGAAGPGLEIEDDECYLCNLEVHPEFRGAGLGNQLMEVAHAYAAECGYRACIATIREDNLPSLKTVFRLGYRVVREVRLARIMSLFFVQTKISGSRATNLAGEGHA